MKNDTLRDPGLVSPIGYFNGNGSTKMVRKNRWKPVHTLVALAIVTILAWHCWTDYSEYLRNCQHSEFIAYMMSQGSNFNDANRAWEKTQGLQSAE